MTMIKLFTLVLSLISFQAFAVEFKGAWELIDDDDGIKVYRRDVKESSIVAFKGETIINTSLKRLVPLFTDTNLKKMWIAKLKHIELVKSLDDLSKIEYYIIKTPWFLKNRDFVYKGELKLAADKKSAKVTVISVDDKYKPKTKNVRANLIFGQYNVKQLSPNKTSIEVVIIADPMGSIPKWLVNIVQKSWPSKTLARLKELAEDPKAYTIPESVEKLF